MLSKKQMQCINLMVIENKTQKQIAKELKKLLKSKNENIRIQAVKDILDRAGYKPVEKREIKDDTEKKKKIDAISSILNQMKSVDDV